MTTESSASQLNPTQERLKKHWLLFIGLGIILLILGIAALATANILAKKLTTLVGGILLLADGIKFPEKI